MLRVANPNASFWRKKKVLVTGHTGFKGGWLSHWLTEMKAEVLGISLNPPSDPNFFDSTRLKERVVDRRVDINDQRALRDAIQEFSPSIVFHLAAQPIVRASYNDPVGTFQTNVLGTVKVLEVLRNLPESPNVTIVITSDKCYQNIEKLEGYTEDERLGGHDPYSASKACAELATAAYIKSYFARTDHRVATARAGNVIGGGDWAQDRLVPDLMRAYENSTTFLMRSPTSIRPWQFVLDPLCGYLLLAERLFEDANIPYSWNFGPNEGMYRVEEIVTTLGKIIPIEVIRSLEAHPHEARYLMLNSNRAKNFLKWQSRLSVEESLLWTAEWHKHRFQGGDLGLFSSHQIEQFVNKDYSV